MIDVCCHWLNDVLAVNRTSGCDQVAVQETVYLKPPDCFPCVLVASYALFCHATYIRLSYADRFVFAFRRASNYVCFYVFLSVAVLRWGQGTQASQILPGPPNFWTQ